MLRRRFAAILPSVLCLTVLCPAVLALPPLTNRVPDYEPPGGDQPAG